MMMDHEVSSNLCGLRSFSRSCSATFLLLFLLLPFLLLLLLVLQQNLRSRQMDLQQQQRGRSSDPSSGFLGQAELTMLFSSSLLQQCFFAVFLLCSPVPFAGRPVDTLSGRTRRSVTHTQLMHDRSRMLQDFRRRMLVQGILDAIHTAEVLQVRSVGTAGGPPAPGPGVHPSTTGSTLQAKPPGGTKNLPVLFQAEEEEEEGGTNLPQETNKSQAYREQKGAGKRRRKGKNGRRKEGEKRKRMTRALRWREEEGSGLHLEWRSLLGLQRALQ